jgi:putative FmdB family regulatory protein
MPIYEYRCKKCGKIIEVERKMEDRNKRLMCKDCNKKMEKIVSKGSFVLTGSGWYATDYKNK